MKSNPQMTQVCRVAALRARSAYRTEKQRLLGELRDLRQRGADTGEFLAQQETDAIKIELLGRIRS